MVKTRCSIASLGLYPRLQESDKNGVGPGTSVIAPVRRDSITEGKDWTTLGGTKG